MQKDPSPGTLSVPVSFVNSYIYAYNNPALAGDPSGRGWFDWIGDAFNAIGKAINDVWNFVATQVRMIQSIVIGYASALAAVAMVITCPISGPIAGAIGGAMLGAAVGASVGGVMGGVWGAVDAVIHGEDFGAGFLRGAISGAITGAISGAIAGAAAGYAAGTKAVEQAANMSNSTAPGGSVATSQNGGVTQSGSYYAANSIESGIYDGTDDILNSIDFKGKIVDPSPIPSPSPTGTPSPSPTFRPFIRTPEGVSSGNGVIGLLMRFENNGMRFM